MKKERRQHEAPIPEALQSKIEQFKGRLWRIKIAEAVLAGFFGLLFSYALVFLSDRIWDTPKWLIGLILLAGVGLFAVFAPYWIHRWVWGHRDEAQLARLIARRFPRLGDRILGIVELQDQSAEGVALSRQLREAAMKQVAEEAESRDFEQAVPAARHRKWAMVVGGVALVCGAFFVVFPQAGVNAMQRWLMPFADIERYTFVSLERLPAELPVPFGEAFEIEVALKSGSVGSPAVAQARVMGGEWVEAELSNSRYLFKIPGQQARQRFQVKAGDARLETTLVPRVRPTITQAGAVVKMPEYLQRGLEEKDLRGGVLSVLKGSEVNIIAQASDVVSRAWFEEPKDTEGKSSGDESGGAARRPMKVSGAQLRSESFEVVENGVSSFMWEDQFGLKGSAPYRIQIEALEDLEPVVYIESSERSYLILAEETLEFEIVADDDFGLKQVGLEWSGEFTKPSPGLPASGELLLEEGDPHKLRMSVDAAFSPSSLAIEPQKLTLRAFAEDYHPERGRAYSSPITVYVLDKTDHAQMLKGKFERSLGELEAAARREQKQLTENQLLEREKPEALLEEDARDQLQRSADEEAENRERIARINEELERLFNEANRNDKVDKEFLKSLADLMRKLKELESSDMPEVEKKFRDASDQRNSADKSKRDLDEAVKRQQEVLEKMRQAIEEANEVNENFEASTFVARLKQAADDSDSVARVFINEMDRMVGLLIEEASSSAREFLSNTEEAQRRLAGEIIWIEEDLLNFVKRSDKPVYGEVLQLMKEADLRLKLDQILRRLSRNQGFETATRSRDLAVELRRWADLIDESRRDPSGGGGGGGGASDPLGDEDFEFMIRVMQMIQKEQDLRARTRALEQMRRSQAKQNLES